MPPDTQLSPSLSTWSSLTATVSTTIVLLYLLMVSTAPITEIFKIGVLFVPALLLIYRPSFIRDHIKSVLVSHLLGWWGMLALFAHVFFGI